MVEQMQKRKCCFIVVVCLTVGEMISLVTIVVYWRLYRYELLAPREQEFCLPCDRLTYSGENADSLKGLSQDYDKERNLTMCCGKTGLVLNSLTAKRVVDRYNSDVNPEISKLNLKDYGCNVQNDSQTSAKLIGLSLHRAPVQVGTTSKIFWNSRAPSYAQSGLKYLNDDGTVYVEKRGLYFVVSQIKIQLEKVHDVDYWTNQTVRHYIHLISHTEGKGSVLLEDVKSPCDMVAATSIFTSVTGAAFSLEVGDRLYVATSHPEHLILDRTNNYFSMHFMHLM